MLADLYVPQYINTLNIDFKKLQNMDKKPLFFQNNFNDNLSSASDHKDHISTINKYHFCLTPKYINTSKGIFYYYD